MDENELEALSAFTALYLYCRPEDVDYKVYDVVPGDSEAPNLLLFASKFEGATPIGESKELIIAKEWVVEYVTKVLQIPIEPETGDVNARQ